MDLHYGRKPNESYKIFRTFYYFSRFKFSFLTKNIVNSLHSTNWLFSSIADLKRHNFAEQSLQLIKHHNNLSDAVIEKIIHILNIDLLNGLQIAMAEVDKKASCDEDKLKVFVCLFVFLIIPI